MFKVFCRSLCGIALLAMLLSARSQAAPPGTPPAVGLRNNTPQVHALKNARLQLSPDKALERGTIVVRDGRIVAVGADVPIPAAAKVWDLAGKTVYAGFIDAYAEQPIDIHVRQGGAAYWNDRVRPQLEVSRQLIVNPVRSAALRSQGIVAQQIAPAGAVIDGGCAVISTADDTAPNLILLDHGPRHLRLTVKRDRERDDYPTSPMGAVALARQAMYDAQWYAQAWKAHQANGNLPRPERNDALVALSPVFAGEQTVLIDAPNEWYFLRAHRFAEEFKLKATIVGSGREYRRLDAIAATGRAVIVPLNFPQPPNVASPEAALNATLTSLLHWDIAPENPARLAQAGVPIAFTTHGLKEVKDFLPRLRQAVERGLSREPALAALTTTAARLCGVADQLGTIEPGRIASLVVADGDIFDKQTKIERVWCDGRPYTVDSAPTINPRGMWDVRLQFIDQPFNANLELSGDDKLGGKFTWRPGRRQPTIEVPLAHVGQRESRLSAAFDGEKFGKPGVARLTGALDEAADGILSLAGEVAWADGTQSALSGRRTAKPKPVDKPPDDPLKRPLDRKASFAVNYPLGAFAVAQAPEQPKAVLLTHATIWTCGPEGVLADASLLVEAGVIKAVGKEIAAPADAIVIDCAGKHLSPGIIDCHSHMGTDGGVNEGGQAITAEVRIGDFINPDDADIYRQLAGGVTTINILHGSANPIGGQNQVCKLRWGVIDSALKFTEAPPGIKFALGENVKQSNWGEKYVTRYPQTRMGVEQIMRDEFAAARKYAADQARHKEGDPPLRRDLELEAVAEILQGKRWIHCHSYRQDEIMSFLKLCDEYKIKIATLQHILEGYKVADAMAVRGIGGSAFSDWWAYKLEVYDAIPYNGAMMHKAGVVVSYNSDDRELARHLNHEAAKAMKYGGVSPEEAIKFVTLNPAKQLRIDNLVGSLEAGKHADVAIWNASPLSVTSRCEQTWVDGRKYFDRADDQRRRETARSMHAQLVQKILQSGDALLSPDELDGIDVDMQPLHDEFCHHDHGGEGHHE